MVNSNEHSYRLAEMQTLSNHRLAENSKDPFCHDL